MPKRDSHESLYNIIARFHSHLLSFQTSHYPNHLKDGSWAIFLEFLQQCRRPVFPSRTRNWSSIYESKKRAEEPTLEASRTNSGSLVLLPTNSVGESQPYWVDLVTFTLTFNCCTLASCEIRRNCLNIQTYPHGCNICEVAALTG
jgi:hypothetical protein